MIGKLVHIQLHHRPLRLPPPIKLTPRYNSHFDESGAKLHNPKIQPKPSDKLYYIHLPVQSVPITTEGVNFRLCVLSPMLAASPEYPF
jgi:hypothetical protein